MRVRDLAARRRWGWVILRLAGGIAATCLEVETASPGFGLGTQEEDGLRSSGVDSEWLVVFVLSDTQTYGLELWRRVGDAN